MTFKSDIGDSLFGLIGGHLFGLFSIGGLIYLFNGFQFPSFDWIYLTFLVLYSFLVYGYAGLTNNDVTIDDTKIEIVNHVPLFKKRISFDYSAIKTITLRHDWTETVGERVKSKRLRYFLLQVAQTFLPFNYKWIKIKTEKEYKFYCFGIEHDYYDNVGPLFEDLYKELRQRHKSVRWTNDTDPYYVGLIKMTE